MVNAQSEEEVDRAFHLLEEAALKNYWKAWNDLGQFHDSHVKDNPPLVRKKRITGRPSTAIGRPWRRDTPMP